MENESPDPQKEKYFGWFWCPQRKDFFRWSALVEYVDNKKVKYKDDSEKWKKLEELNRAWKVNTEG